ncbi:hypothetical protein HAX54_024117 [Datura stramonium]|uniref:FLZ-type domain-containing protein n=1 Tax=Datura stramonium TaxID=4076 RepID=A0ABS8UZZ5_DATST|nr:hypothetical protein [Datura stramonium]
MVGLSVVLEGYNEDISTGKNTSITAGSTAAGSSWQILNKASMVMKPTSPTTPSSPFSRGKSPAAVIASGFLDYCYLCKKKLLPSEDIYMYKGEWAFCSVECRCRQIFMDEEESTKAKKKDYMKPQASTSSSNKSFTSSSSSPSSSRSRKTEAANRPDGFIY